MADNPPRGRKSGASKWSRLPLVVLLSLLVVAAALVFVAYSVYDENNPRGFPSEVATGVLLNGAVVITLGAVVTTILSFASEIRAHADRDADKMLELFRRMRGAHVRVALAQQILRAQHDARTYRKQMRALLSVVKDLEEVREEVKVSGHLYADGDRRSIMEGIALIIEYLQVGISEYVTWCEQAGGQSHETRPQAEDAWVSVLVDQDTGRPKRDPGDEDWEPAGQMPKAYDAGLDLSKRVMRACVYGTTRKATAARHASKRPETGAAR